MIHSDPSNGCIRCIDYQKSGIFRAHLNSAKDGCECLPWEADDTTALGRTSNDLIPNTEFDMTASLDSGCKCNDGKYTLTKNGLQCLDCPTTAGFLPIDQLTNCETVDQCEARGFESPQLDESTDPPTVRCGCDTTKNFADNVGPVQDTEGCWCDTGENWWTLRTDGEYKETDQYELDIDYSDISNECLMIFQLNHHNNFCVIP